MPSEQHAALRELVADMDAGRVQMLLIVGESNPVLDGAGRSQVRRRDGQGRRCASHSGLFLDETATLCHWHVPAAHYLEAWSDARTFDGTVSIVQPLIQPMYGGKSAHEVIATLFERPERNGYDLVREYWMAQPLVRRPAPRRSPATAATRATAASPAPAAGDRRRLPRRPCRRPPPPTSNSAQRPVREGWRQWLHDGFIPGTAFTRTVARLALAPAASATRDAGVAASR